MDNNVFTFAYQGYTLAQLEAFVAEGGKPQKMIDEVNRRKAVIAGDYSVATPAERLHAVREGKL